MDDKVKLFLKYMEKEKELILQWDEEDGIDTSAEDYEMDLTMISRVKAFINYRNIRIEEAWYSKLSQGMDSKERISKLYEYDEKRSKMHSLALTSLDGFNKFGEKYNLEKFYEGQMLTRSEIENYKNISTRKDVTNFFLGFIDQLSKTPSIKIKEYMSDIGVKEGKQEMSFISSLQSSVQKIDRDYGVVSDFVEDDADIKFKDDDFFESR